jgi:hypothetical protein
VQFLQLAYGLQKSTPAQERMSLLHDVLFLDPILWQLPNLCGSPFSYGQMEKPCTTTNWMT